MSPHLAPQDVRPPPRPLGAFLGAEEACALPTASLRIHVPQEVPRADPTRGEGQ